MPLRASFKRVMVEKYGLPAAVVENIINDMLYLVECRDDVLLQPIAPADNNQIDEAQAAVHNAVVKYKRPKFKESLG